MNDFLDTSAFVKIYHLEDGTDEILDIYGGEAPILISDLTRIEFLSALHHKFREREISADVLDAVLLRFQEDLLERYDVLSFTLLVVEEAGRLLSQYGKRLGLKTLDGLQLAFFTTHADAENVFVCADGTSANIATLEGLNSWVPQGRRPKQNDPVLPEVGMKPRVFLSPPHMGGAERIFVRKAFDSNYIAPLGPMVDAFERAFGEYTGCRWCAIRPRRWAREGGRA